jgi:hypothetical protein
MPSSWSESNRMHSTNKRIEAADYSIHEDADKYEFDEYDEGGPEYDFEMFHEEPEDAYLDAAYEDRYYMPEPEFDIY